MVSVRERRKHARSVHLKGTVSRHAQQRVDERVRDVMERHDAAAVERRTRKVGIGLRPHEDGAPAGAGSPQEPPPGA